MTRAPRISPARIVSGLLLAWLGLQPLSAQGANAAKAAAPGKVEIHVEHGIPLPWGKPGFRIEIAGWEPNGNLALYAIAPDGTQLALIPKEKPVQADADGAFSVDIDYARRGFSPGHWMFLAAGKPGIHEFEADLPRVLPPTAQHRKWRLVFGGPGSGGDPGGTEK
jgi:hypothetical protein